MIVAYMHTLPTSQQYILYLLNIMHYTNKYKYVHFVYILYVHNKYLVLYILVSLSDTYLLINQIPNS